MRSCKIKNKSHTQEMMNIYLKVIVVNLDIKKQLRFENSGQNYFGF